MFIYNNIHNSNTVTKKNSGKKRVELLKAKVKKGAGSGGKKRGEGIRRSYSFNGAGCRRRRSSGKSLQKRNIKFLKQLGFKIKK